MGVAAPAATGAGWLSLATYPANIVDARAAYVAISRDRSHAALYTDSRARLAEVLGIRDAQIGAIGGPEASIYETNSIQFSGDGSSLLRTPFQR